MSVTGPTSAPREPLYPIKEESTGSIERLGLDSPVARAASIHKGIATEHLGFVPTEASPRIVPINKDKLSNMGHSQETEELREQNNLVFAFLSKMVSLIREAFNRAIQSIKNIFGVQSIEETDPMQLSLATKKLMDCFEKFANYDVEGIFRRSGSKIQVDALVDQVSEPSFVSKDLEMEDGVALFTQSSVEQIQGGAEGPTLEMADALKRLFGKMELFGEKDFINTGNLLAKKNEKETIEELRGFVAQLPDHQKEALSQMMNILGNISSNNTKNKMTPAALAIVFGPRLFKLENPEKPMVLITEKDAIARVTTNLIIHRAKIFA